MIILEFDSDAVKLLEAVRKGQKISLLKLAKRPISGLPDDAVSEAITAILNESKIKNPGQLIISIPRHLVTARNLRLPSLDDVELTNMVNLQAGKQLPYSASELVWDFKVIEKKSDGYSDVFLAIAHRNVIDRFIAILANCKLTANRIILNSEALSGWYIAVCAPQSEEAALEPSGAIIDIDTSYIEIAILHGKGLEFSRSFPYKDNPEETSEEIKKTFLSYEKENAKKVTSIILTGIEEKAAKLRPCLEAIYKETKIDFIHPLKVISMDYRETLAEYFDLSREASFSNILGIAYNFKDIKMDFLPAEEKSRIAKANKKIALLKTTMLLCAVGIFLLGAFIKSALDTKEQLRLIDAKVKEIEPKVRRLKQISQELDIVKQHLDMKGSSIDVIREVYKIIPAGVSISVLDFEFGKSLTLRGQSADLSSVFKFSSDLEKSPYFENCQIKYAQKRSLKGQEIVDFELACNLSGIIK